MQQQEQLDEESGNDVVTIQNLIAGPQGDPTCGTDFRDTTRWHRLQSVKKAL